MSSPYIRRSLERALTRAAREFPAVVLTGPRQSGKTTLLKRLFGKTHEYVSLETPDAQAAAQSDPRGFLEMNPAPAILDEMQRAPGLLPYIKERIDARRSAKGQYLLTGSQNLLLLESVTESLAGRAAVLRLLPLSWREIQGRPDAPLLWEAAAPKRRGAGASGVSYSELWKGFLRGGYPELVVEPKRDLALWHSSYIQTYLERDVRSVRQVGDLTQFQNFLRVLAARAGQLLNLADVSRDLGVAVNTSKAWLSVLEASFQVVVLRPYYANAGKRLVKTPKVYFTDTGTLCHLTGLKDPEHAAAGPMAGAIFETAIMTELLKSFWHRGEEPQLYFWRTSAGAEVDFILAASGKLIPIEAKLSATPRPAMAASIQTFQQDYGKAAAAGYVVHPGTVRLPLAPGARAIPFGDL